MPIFKAGMNADQMRAVAEALVEYLKPQITCHGQFGDHPPDPELVPIVPVAIRHSRSGAPWAIFGDPDKVDGRWYRVIDIHPLDDYFGGHVVMAPDGGQTAWTSDPWAIGPAPNQESLVGAANQYGTEPTL
jgi:hypothetical protein